MERLRCSLFPSSVCVIVLFVNFLERHSIEHWTASSVGHIEKLQVGFARWKKKRESENVDHFCVFFNLFRERKLIKVFFRCFRYFFFFLAHVSREEKGNFIFIVFFLLYIVNGGIGKRGL